MENGADLHQSEAQVGNNCELRMGCIFSAHAIANKTLKGL
jgi:hypothetical protein